MAAIRLRYPIVGSGLTREETASLFAAAAMMILQERALDEDATLADSVIAATVPLLPPMKKIQKQQRLQQSDLMGGLLPGLLLFFETYWPNWPRGSPKSTATS